jgi:hypothetical protein
MTSTLVLRAYSEAQQRKKKQKSKSANLERRKKEKQRNWWSPPRWPLHALVFDSETRTDELQSLTSGFFRILRSDGDAYSDVREEGIFYDPDELSDSELRTLKRCRETAQTSGDVVTHKVVVVTKRQFIQKYFFPHAEAGSLIVGFNLPFDLTRIASDARPATRLDHDWPLVFSNRSSNPDKLQKREFRIKLNRKDSKIAFISLSGKFVKRGRFRSRGRFLDLYALAFTLTNTSYSLKSLAKELKKKGYKVPQKSKHEPTGRVTRKGIAYCRQDVRATSGILNALRTEFDRHPNLVGILNPDNAVSPASIFKAYLEAMGVMFPSKKFRLSRKIQGTANQAYFGGRSEVHIRAATVPVVHTDFLSQYPTVILNMGLWRFLIAKELVIRPATRSITALLNRVLRNPDIVFDPAFWKTITGYALVMPGGDILPIRTEYNHETGDTNIGLNVFERSDRPSWFAIPDLVASVLLAQKVPKLLKAIRVVPIGIQKGLRKIALRGKEEVDPVTGNLFRTLIEAKEREKKSDPEQAYFLKIMANSGYGIFIETTPRRVSRPAEVKAYSGELVYKNKSKVVEGKGRFYCPVISSLITAGGRLLLALLETQIRSERGTYLFCDTDSMAIVAAKKARRVRLSDPEEAEKHSVAALSWSKVDKIIGRFRSLNPYRFAGSILKVEKDSLNRQLYGYGVSAKRYCLFDENFKIVHASSHGLGHLFVPGAKWNKEIEAFEWVREVWEFIIKRDPTARLSRLFSSPAMMRVAMTTPKVQMWRTIDEKQKDLPYRNRVKPSNFVVTPLIDREGDDQHPDGFPKHVKRKDFMLIAPYSSKRPNFYKLRYINVHDGKSYALAPLNQKKDSDASPMTLEKVVRSHALHPEAKSVGPDGFPCTGFTRGLLQRARIIAEGPPILIGKETDRRWEQDDDPSIFEALLIEHKQGETALITTDIRLGNRLRNCGMSVRRIAETEKLNPSTVQRAMTGKRIRKSVAAKLWRFLNKNRHRNARK